MCIRDRLLCVGLFSCNIRVYTVVYCFHVDLKAVTRTSRQCFWLALLYLVLLGVDNTSSQLGIDHNERQCTTDTVTIWLEVHYRTPGQQAERWRRRERCWLLFLVCHEHSLFWVFLGHFPMLLCKNYGMNQKIGKNLLCMLVIKDGHSSKFSHFWWKLLETLAALWFVFLCDLSRFYKLF